MYIKQSREKEDVYVFKKGDLLCGCNGCAVVDM